MNAAHQIVALRKLVTDLYGGLADMTSSSTPLVSAVLSHKSIIQSLASTAVTKDRSGNVSVPGSLTANRIIANSVDLVSAITALQSAMSTKQSTLTAGTGISITGSVISLSYGIDTTVTASSSNLVTSGAVAAAIAGGAFSLPIATTTQLGAVKIGSGLSVNAAGILTTPAQQNVLEVVKLNGSALTIVSKAIDIPVATSIAFGVVKIGKGINIENGVISVSMPSNITTGVILGSSSASVSSGAAVIPVAASGTFGVVKVGVGLFIEDGAIGTSAESNVLENIAIGSVSSTIALSSKTAVIPFATSEAFGVVKIGSGLSVANGVVSAPGEANVVTGMSIAGAAASLSNKILILPSATSSAFGVVKIDGTTLQVNASGQLFVASGGGGGTVTDVRINGVTVLASGVANIPVGTSTAFGVIKVDGTTLKLDSNSVAFIPSATTSAFGIVKTDGATLQVNTQGQLYVRSATSSLAGVVIPDYSTLSVDGNGKLCARLSKAVTDVKLGTATCVTEGVATVPLGTNAAFGVVKIDGTTIQVDGTTSAIKVPYAGTGTFGVVKYDGTTIRQNGSSQLYVPMATSSVFGVMKRGTGLSIPSEGEDFGKVTVDFSVVASRSYVDTLIGNINSVLATVLGE